MLGSGTCAINAHLSMAPTASSGPTASIAISPASSRFRMRWLARSSGSSLASSRFACACAAQADQYRGLRPIRARAASGYAIARWQPEPALPLLERAVKLDPGFAEAHAWLAMSFHFGSMYWGQAPHRAEGLAAAQRAVSLDAQNARPDGHMTLGYLRTYELKLADGVAEFEIDAPSQPKPCRRLGSFRRPQGLRGQAHRGGRMCEERLPAQSSSAQPLLLASRVGRICRPPL